MISPINNQNINYEKHYHIIFLMPQSYMAGYGEMIDSDTIPDSNILRILHRLRGDIRWESAYHPLNNKSPSDAFGLVFPFLRNIWNLITVLR